MRIRVSFEYLAGACLWADDDEARQRWDSAVEPAEVGLPAVLAGEGEALMDEFNAGHALEDNAVVARWPVEAAEDFGARAADWTARVAAALSPTGIEVVPYGSEPAGEAGPEFEGSVVACFADEAARAAADRKEAAGSGWAEVAVWPGDIFQLRETERSPADLLAKLEREPGFVCGWWQARAGGADAMLEGDPEDHAVTCVRDRNATGLANFLSWLRVERVHLHPELAGEPWQPSARHRLADPGGSWWEWFTFARNAAKAVRGERPSARYLRAERERLFHRWTHGGSRRGWPAGFGEAFERIGLRREVFNRWAK